MPKATNQEKSIRVNMLIQKSLHPRVFDILEGLKGSSLAEKVRHLCAVGELVESGMLSLVAAQPPHNKPQTSQQHEQRDGENRSADFADYE